MANNHLNSDDRFWHFSDQLRLQTTTPSFSSLSLGDNIWTHDPDAFLSRRRNEDPRKVSQDPSSNSKNTTAAAANNNNNNNTSNKTINSSFGWKNSRSLLNKEFLKPTSGGRRNLNYNEDFGGKGAAFAAKKKNIGNNNNNNSSSRSNTNGSENGSADKALDKKFKTLPASEALPRSEAVGGYIFVCNNDTMPENLQRMLFGLPPRYRDSVRAITPGLPLFLYNYSTHQLHGIYQASSFGGANIDPSAWEDKKCPGESRFPAQVRATTRRTYVPLEEEDFRPILHHYDGPKFRLELSVPEALALLDKFEEKIYY